MKVRLHWWTIVSAVVVAATAAAARALPPGFQLQCFGDILQSAVLAVLTLVCLVNAREKHGHESAFWALMSLGAGLWFTATFMWTVYEVFLRKPVPVPFVGDVLFFLHIVPIMGALACRPHREHHSRKLPFGALDFMLLLVWWIYLYAYVVIPWQYVYPDATIYAYNFNVLYIVENTILVAALAVQCHRAEGTWRRIYGHLLIAATVYLLGSQLVNGAITRGQYYTGSLYDVPLVVAMCWFVGTALLARRSETTPLAGSGTAWHGIVAARLAMLAVLSLPFLAFAAIYSNDPKPVTNFRLVTTLGAMVLLAFFLFLKQHFLDRELVRVIAVSERNLETQRKLQVQLVQAEKLASLGQLIAGAAHEINNPLTAIIGYSDLLVQDVAAPEHSRRFATKISEQARRTRDLVSDLLKFAQESPGQKTAVDLNALVLDAMEIHEFDTSDRIFMRRALDPTLPRVWGDPNQLLQVCFHVISNAVDAMRECGGTLTVTTRRRGDHAVAEFADTGPGVKDPQRIFDPFYTTKPIGKGTGLGLSATYGIIREHGGQIVCENAPNGGAVFTVLLPLATPEQAAAVSASS